MIKLMHVSYDLLQLPPLVLLVLLLVLFAAFGAVSTYLFRRYVKIRFLRSHNEILGYIFAILGGFYGLLLGFVVFLVWDSSNDAQTNSNREGSLAKGLYRDIRYYPDSQAVKPLMKSYIGYVHSVVETEFPTMEKLEKLTSKNRVHFNEVFREMELLDARDPRIEQMFRHLNELATARSLRQLDAYSEIPLEIWIPLLLGAFIILVFAMIVDVESVKLHMFVNALMGAFIAMVIYMIVILDHPFTGKIKIEPDDYRNILLMVREGK